MKPINMHWLYLVMAIILEVSGTTSMKLSNGFTRLMPSIAMFIFYALSFIFLTFAIKKIDIGVAYAIWSGLGTACIGVIGIGLFKEPATAIKFISLGLIIIGIVGLNLTGKIH
ncbi:MAG: multidrug efflux SMR transporter [Planctomycetota bacterium]